MSSRPVGWRPHDAFSFINACEFGVVEVGIPGGGDIVRNTSVTPESNFLLANSLVNTVPLVKVQK